MRCDAMRRDANHAMRCDTDTMRLYFRFWAGKINSRALFALSKCGGFSMRCLALSQRNYRFFRSKSGVGRTLRKREPGESVCFSLSSRIYDDMGCCGLGGRLAVPCRLSTPSGMVEG
jgi:hypothetical protein